MHYIKQIFEGKTEEWVHSRFVRYGRGMFNGPVISVKAKSGGFKVSSSWEYATALIEVLAASGGLIQVKGGVFSKRDISVVLNDFLDLGKEKKKMGRYSAEVSGELSADELKGLLAIIPDAIILWDSSSSKNKVKCKKKPPKPGSKVDECFLSADFEEEHFEAVKNEILFDVADQFTEAKASHKYFIDELIAPEGVSDPARIRVEAKRKGRIERTLEVDGVSSGTVLEFLI